MRIADIEPGKIYSYGGRYNRQYLLVTGFTEDKPRQVIGQLVDYHYNGVGFSCEQTTLVRIVASNQVKRLVAANLEELEAQAERTKAEEAERRRIRTERAERTTEALNRIAAATGIAITGREAESPLATYTFTLEDLEAIAKALTSESEPF